MDGTIVASQLTAIEPSRAEGAVRFEVAASRHDAALRRLLRENPMPGAISLSLEREPDYFAGAEIEGPEHQTLIAIEGDRVICAGGISIRRRFINGLPMRVGYLGGLRMDASCRGRMGVIRGGYQLFRQLHERGGPPIYLTSIVADNFSARRLLERGLRGMPTYRFLGDFVTLVIPRMRREDGYKSAVDGLRVVSGGGERMADVTSLLNKHHREYQFAPVWSADELQSWEFRMVVSRDGTPMGCAAIWDQRAIKQTVVRGYANRLRLARPLINFVSALRGRPGLPRIGRPVSCAFVSHLAMESHRPEVVELLICDLLGEAHSRKIDYLTIGFDARDTRLARLRKIFGPREYVSRLYAVHWDDGAELARDLDDRLLAPEVAIL